MQNLKKPGFRDILADRDFLKLWLGQAISMVGDNLGGIALTVMMVQRTGSAMVLSVAFLISWLPTILLGPLAGVIIDRASRRTVLIVSDLMRGLVTLALAFVCRGGQLPLGYAYAWMLLLSVFRVLYHPATMAIIPSMVPPERLQRANSLQGMAMSISGVAGPALAGLAIAAFGGAVALVLDAASFFLSAGLIAWSHPQDDGRVAHTNQPALQGFGEGLRFFGRNHLALLILMTTIVANFCANPSGLALQMHVLKTLGGTSEALGFVYSVSAGASLAASMVMLARKRWPMLGRIMLLAAAVSGLGYLLTGFQTNVAMVPLTLALSGLAGPFVQMTVTTIYQEITPAEMRGRVFAVRTTLATALSPASMLLGGWTIDTFGSRIVLFGIGLVMILAMGALSLTPAARQSAYFRRRVAVPEVAGTSA